MLRGDDPFILLFTSGTTGSPKGISYPIKMLLPGAVYMRYGIDLLPEDRYWNVADPGWGSGMFYTVVGPLLLGHATTFYEGGFAVESAVPCCGAYRVPADDGGGRRSGGPDHRPTSRCQQRG
jgi:acetyl-CoA synthetase